MSARPLIYLLPFLFAAEFRLRFGISFLVAELAILAVWVVAFERQLTANTRKLAPISGLMADAATVFIIALFGLIGIALERDSGHAMSAYRDLLGPFLFYLGFRCLRLRRIEIDRLVHLSVGIAAISALLGIVQFWTGRFIWYLADQSWAEYKFEFITGSVVGKYLHTSGAMAVGLYGASTDFGFYLVIPTVVAFSLCWAVRRPVIRVGLTLAASILFLGLTVTFFRSGLLCAIACLLYMVLVVKRRTLMERFVVWSAVGLVALTGITVAPLLAWDSWGTAGGRLEMIADALDLIVRHPVVLLTGGFADDYNAFYNQSQSVHNWVLYGIIRYGGVVTIAMIVFSCRWLLKIFRSTKICKTPERGLLTALFSGLGSVILVMGLTTPILDNAQETMIVLFWMAIAVGYLDGSPVSSDAPLVQSRVGCQLA